MSDRLDLLRLEMKEKGFDAVLVNQPENHLYFSSFNNPDGSLLIGEYSAFAFEDFRYIEAAERGISKDDFNVIMPEGKIYSYIKEALSSMSAKAVAFEDGFISCRFLEELKNKCPDIDFVPLGDTVDGIREIKSEAEADCIIKAQRIAEKAYGELLSDFEINQTEMYTAAKLEFLMKKYGSEGASFETIAVSGKNSSSPHGVPRNVKLEKGFLTFDFGAVYGGYHSDMTRTVVIGKATPEMKKLYNTVLEAQLAVEKVISAGKSLFAMDKIARDIIDNAGYKGAFGHSLGHGVGLQIHERPWMGPSASDKKLLPGHIVTVEPGIYIPEKYGCRIEDMVYIGKSGTILLTDFSKDIMEL